MDHDRLFKLLLGPRMEAFIRLLFPGMAEGIDFSSLDPLDKEGFTDIPEGYHRESDILVRVRERGGEGKIFLILLEIEDREGRTRPTSAGQPHGSPSAPERVPIGERLMVYYGALWSRYRQPIVPIVLYLFKAKRGITKEIYHHGVLGEAYLELRYWVVGLPKLVAARYLARGGALAAALAALMKRGRWSTSRLKVECLKAIMDSNDDTETKLLAWHCVQTYLSLDDVSERRTRRLLRREGYMEAKKMERTWIDEIREEGRQEGRQQGRQEGRQEGRQQGRQQGRIEGMQTMLLNLLKLKFGPLDADVETRVREIREPAMLDRLSEQVLTADRVSDLDLSM